MVFRYQIDIATTKRKENGLSATLHAHHIVNKCCVVSNWDVESAITTGTLDW